MAETAYILDGHSQIYRAYYAPFRDLTSPSGEPTRATYVFCSMLLKFIADRKPQYLAMAVDGPAEKLLRRKIFPDYKVTRKPMPEDLPPQVRRIFQIVEAMGVPILRAEGYEADDIIATCVEKLASPQTRVVLISRDKDLDQLVGDNSVLYDPMKDETIDAPAILAQKGYPPEKAVEVQTLCGDDIDNIPGIPGVGPKTAAKLISQYGTAEEVLRHADELTPKLSQAVKAAAEAVAMSRKLVTLDRNVPMDIRLENLAFSGLRADVLRPIFRELGFYRLLEQLDRLSPAAAPTLLDTPLAEKPAEPAEPQVVQPSATQTTAADFDYRCVATAEELEALGRELAGVKRLAVDTETTSVRPMWAEMVGMSLSAVPGKAYYLPVKGPLGSETLDLDDIRRVLGPILADPGIEKVGQNLKYDLIILANVGLELRGPMFDTMLAAYALDSTRASYRLDVLGAEFLNHRSIPIVDLIGRGSRQITMNLVPVELVTKYASEDADLSLRLADVLEKKLRDEGLTELFRRLEMPLMPVLADMEREGVRVDAAVLKQMNVEFSRQADVLRDRILAAAGVAFNPDSPKQLAQVLHEKLNLPVVKRTKTGPSTDSSVLEELAVLHELPALVLDYRRCTKLLSTYLVALGECIHPRTGRVHTSFHQAATATGRLSSSDPNLQNIPIRTEEGRQIRRAFVADEGCVLLSADYSQVELRVLAHLCRDETLLRAFQQDRDIHRIVAAEVFGVPVDEVTPEQRARAKTVNFGIIYGQTAFGLSVTLRIPRNEAADFIREYRKRFPRIDEFLAECVASARSRGYVETLVGRRRKIAEIDSPNSARRALAERLAINSVVQGSAADLIKRAMINIARKIRDENRPARMLLQIHDELLFEVPENAVEAEKAMIVSEMSGAFDLRVPLKVDVGVGKNWMVAK
jgi:DNA polymerase-1